MRRLLNRLRSDEAGFSLPELLTAMIIGGVVLGALMTLMTTGFFKAAEITDRADAAQSGRSAMDRIVTLLDSTICLDPSSAGIVPPLIGSSALPTTQGSDSNYVAFYADLNGVSNSPDEYTITYDPTAKTLTEQRFDSGGTLPNLTWPATATATRVLASNVVQARDPQTKAQQPIFRYYDYEADGTIASPLATPITQAIAPSVIRVLVAFQSISSRTKREDARSTMIDGQSAVGTPDPSNPGAGSCP
jgi:prepilin-type N-terminal cleavage/methylation domain-containing protein